MKRKPLIAADLFCGAGGTSAGLLDAGADLGLDIQLTAINHWDVAVATHTANHPKARHLCASLDALNPRDLYAPGELKFLWASPECTHHSVARGGKPIKDQSRATAWCVTRWAEALRPDILLIENVKEFRSWGPSMRKRIRHKDGTSTIEDVPDPRHKGEIFLSWIRNLEAIGYRVEQRILCAADYGDPTTRQRLFIQCVRKGSRYKLCWPNPTHAETPQRDLFGAKRKPWVPAREIIDWQLKGASIFSRKKPLAENTLRRIGIGLERFGLKDFIVPQQRFDNQSADSVDKPLRTITTTGGRLFNLISPAIVKLRGTSTVADVNQPVPTVTGARNLGVMEPCLVEVNHGKNGACSDAYRVTSLNKPMKAVTGSRGQALCEFVMQTDQTGGNGSGVRPTDQPMPTVVPKQNSAVVEAFILPREGVHRGNAPRSVDQPLPTITTKNGTSLVEPYIVPANFGDRKGQRPRCHSIDKPLPTVVGSNNHALVEPLVEPFVIGAGGPEYSGAARSTSQPLKTVMCKDTKAVIEPVIVKYYGSGIAKPVSQTLDAVTTTERFGLAEPILEHLTAAVKAGRKPLLEINGQTYVLDILFRMLNWHELSQAQGFRKDYQFTGKTEDIVKQIGNAVPRRLARALGRAVLSQNPNV